MDSQSLKLPILKFLYKDDSATYSVEAIAENFPKSKIVYIRRVVELLEEDGFIKQDKKHAATSEKVNFETEKTYPPDPIYRISPAGSSYLSDRKKTIISYRLSICAIIISIIALFVKIIQSFVELLITHLLNDYF